MTLEQRGRTSRCKAFSKVWWCTGWKVSTTSERAKNCGYLTNSKSKQWRLSANPDRKNYFLRNCRRAKALMIGGKFPKAFSKDRLSLANNVCKIFMSPCYHSRLRAKA